MKKWVLALVIAAGLISGIASYAAAYDPCPSPPCVGVDSGSQCPVID